MDFVSLLSKSWQDYKRNFRLNLKIFWWFLIMPLLLVFIIIILFSIIFLSTIKDLDLNSNAKNVSPLITNAIKEISIKNFLVLTGNVVSNTTQLNQFNNLFSIPSPFLTFLVVILFLALILTFLYYLMYISLMFSSIYNVKGVMGLKDAVKGGIKYFWKILGLSIIIAIVLILLFLVPLIPAIILILLGVSKLISL